MGAPSNWPSWISGPLEHIAGYKKREFRDATLSSSMLPRCPYWSAKLRFFMIVPNHWNKLYWQVRCWTRLPCIGIGWAQARLHPVHVAFANTGCTFWTMVYHPDQADRVLYRRVKIDQSLFNAGFLAFTSMSEVATLRTKSMYCLVKMPPPNGLLSLTKSIDHSSSTTPAPILKIWQI